MGATCIGGNKCRGEVANPLHVNLVEEVVNQREETKVPRKCD